MPKKRPFMCSYCGLEVEDQGDYFHLRIRNEESKIGRQFNACRSCLTVGLFDLPPNNAEEEEFQKELEARKGNK